MTAVREGCQSLHANMMRYLIQKDWDGLCNPYESIESKMQLVVESYICLGLKKPDELTVAWAVAAAALCHFKTLPGCSKLYAIVQYMKASFRSSQQQLVPRMIEKYPGLPAQLPASILAYAYAGDDQPVTKHVDGLSHAAVKHIPLRKSSKLLAEEAKADDTSMQSPSSSQASSSKLDWSSWLLAGSPLHHTLQTLQPQPLKSGGSKPVGADGYATDERMDEDSDTTLELPGLKIPQKAPHIQPKAPQLTRAKKSSTRRWGARKDQKNKRW